MQYHLPVSYSTTQAYPDESIVGILALEAGTQMVGRLQHTRRTGGASKRKSLPSVFYQRLSSQDDDAEWPPSDGLGRLWSGGLVRHVPSFSADPAFALLPLPALPLLSPTYFPSPSHWSVSSHCSVPTTQSPPTGSQRDHQETTSPPRPSSQCEEELPTLPAPTYRKVIIPNSCHQQFASLKVTLLVFDTAAEGGGPELKTPEASKEARE